MGRLSKNVNPKILDRTKRILAVLGCLTILGAAIATMPLAANAQGSRYSLTIRNQSRYRIDRLYMSTSDESTWGPDQLGRYVIRPNSQFTLNNIRPGEYDLKLVDEDGDACVIRRVDFFTNKSWTITTSMLVNCERG
jgi:hypothetical protein